MGSETLVGADPFDGTIVPGLADSYEIAPDGVTYTFNLNKDAKWHDGTPLTAADVAFTVDAYLSTETGSSYTTQIGLELASYEIVDDKTIKLIAKDKLAQLPRLHKRAMCGGLCIAVVHHSGTKQWRAFKATDLPIGPASWDLSKYPVFPTAEAALQQFKELT